MLSHSLTGEREDEEAFISNVKCEMEILKGTEKYGIGSN